MFTKVINYFNQLGIEYESSIEDDDLIINFFIEYEFFSSNVEIIISNKRNLLSAKLYINDIYELTNALYIAINSLNSESIYLKSYYDIFNERIVVGGNFNIVDNIDIMINNLLVILTKTDVLLIENIYNSICEDD